MHIKEYLIKHKEKLSFSGIEREAELPAKSLSNYVAGLRPLSDEKIKAVEKVLVKMKYPPIK